MEWWRGRSAPVKVVTEAAQACVVVGVPRSASHLVLMAHGLHGGPQDLIYMAERLVEQQGEGLVVLIAKCNMGIQATHDGIDTGGKRMAEEVCDFVDKELGIQVHAAPAENKQKLYFSVVGHSLGGLYARYCIGQLYQWGFFRHVVPVSFTTFATPHLGSRRPPRGMINPIISWYTNNFVSATGTQLMLGDQFGVAGEPLLQVMASSESSFFLALTLFPNRIVYANIANDVQVPFSTAAIMPSNPYLSGKRQVIFSDTYNPVLADQVSMKDFTLDVGEVGQDEELLEQSQLYSSDVKKEILIDMLESLNKLHWTRVCVKFDNVFAHIYIVGKEKFYAKNGRRLADGVLRYFIDHFQMDAGGTLESHENDTDQSDHEEESPLSEGTPPSKRTRRRKRSAPSGEPKNVEEKNKVTSIGVE